MGDNNGVSVPLKQKGTDNEGYKGFAGLVFIGRNIHHAGQFIPDTHIALIRIFHVLNRHGGNAVGYPICGHAYLRAIGKAGISGYA